MTGPVAVDSSALVAVLKGEAEEIAFLDVLTSRDILVGWPTIFETRIWLLRQAPSRRPEWLDMFVTTSAVRKIAFDGALESMANSAFEKFGKGKHPAALNFGDCMAYAIAAHHKVPLLFKGRDFGETDVAVHPASVRG